MTGNARKAWTGAAWLALALLAYATYDAFLAVSRVATDLNGDGKSDIVLHHQGNGRVFRLLMNGFSTAASGMAYAEPDTAWRIVADGDFDGDGVSDLLWRNVRTGQVHLQPFGRDGMPLPGALVHVERDPAWQVAGVPDIDGDGSADILWWNRGTGGAYVMLMRGPSIVRQGFLTGGPDAGWRIAATGSLSGGVKADQIVWQHAATGKVRVTTIDTSGGVFGQSGEALQPEGAAPARIVAGADFDGDGRMDLVSRDDLTGEVVMMRMQGALVLDRRPVHRERDPAWRLAATGDYDGDGKADLLWWNERTGQVYMMLMNGFAIASQALVYTEPDTAWKAWGAWVDGPGAKGNEAAGGGRGN